MNTSELLQVLVLGTITLAVLLYKRCGLTLLAFDRIRARIIGLNTRWLSALVLEACWP